MNEITHIGITGNIRLLSIILCCMMLLQGCMSNSSHIDLTGGDSGGEGPEGTYSAGFGLMDRALPIPYKKLHSQNFNVVLSLGGMTRSDLATDGSHELNDPFTEIAQELLSQIFLSADNMETFNP